MIEYINNTNTFKLKYSSVVYPPFNINVNTIYDCTIENNIYSIIINKIKKDFNVEYIKALFSPIEGKWSDYIKTFEIPIIEKEVNPNIEIKSEPIKNKIPIISEVIIPKPIVK